MGSGEALLEFWERGLKTTAKPTITYDWYRWLLPAVDTPWEPGKAFLPMTTAKAN